MGLSASVAPRRGRCADEPGLESPGYRQGIAPRWVDAARPQLAELEAESTGAQDVSRLHGIASHEDFAVTQDVVLYHVRSDHGNDDPVVAGEAAAGGFGEGELVRDAALDFRRIHGIDEPGVVLPVAPAEVVR